MTDYRENYNKWITDSRVDGETKSFLKGLTDEKDLEDRFYKDLEFGTGGLRGIIGAGNNRMNLYTVRRATLGLARELKSRGEDFAKRGVVIAHDSRRFSREFALECARALAASGIRAYLFDDLRPTPELSFAVRRLGCARGIVITASHNPKEYNGYKVYGEDGGQIPPETAEKILAFINGADLFERIDEKQEPPVIVGEDLDREYLNCVIEQAADIAVKSDFKMVYTPLHGSGNKLVRRILNMAGVENVFVVPEQEKPDPDFPTVRSPNPEDGEALSLAMKYAAEQNADVVIGTDPDCDRVGVAVKNRDGRYTPLNGNQTGVLLCEFLMRTRELPENAAVIKTIVTTDMVNSVAKDYGVKVVDVLTGFKYIGEKIREFEEGGFENRFLFGLEESFGYLAGTYARDKDAVVASMLIAQMAADYKAKGLSLCDALAALYEKHGYFTETLRTAALEGADGLLKARAIMNAFRQEKYETLGGVRVVKMTDYLNGETGLPKSDVVKYALENGSWFAARPSGTEPKIKFYFGARGKTEKEAHENLKSLMEAVNIR